MGDHEVVIARRVIRHSVAIIEALIEGAQRAQAMEGEMFVVYMWCKAVPDEGLEAGFTIAVDEAKYLNSLCFEQCTETECVWMVPGTVEQEGL